MTRASAPGKVILFGEHAVVYGRPAIAAPVSEARVRVEVTPGEREGIFVEAEDTGEAFWLREAEEGNPLALAVQLTLDALALGSSPALRVHIQSDLPIAAGLGSSAAVSVAMIRGLSAHLGRELSAERQSAMAYQVEELHHGTPSGIDNTVIAYGQPVRFQKGSPPTVFTVPAPFRLIIADTGLPSPTGDAVAGVRSRWLKTRARYERLFDEIGDLVETAHRAIAAGRPSELGTLLDRNQRLLEELEVSHPRLQELIAVARAAGAEGAKLSGGGEGGNMIALVRPTDASEVAAALQAAGASRLIQTEVGG